jgi:integrase
MRSKQLEYTGPFKDVIPGFVEHKRAMGYDYAYTDLYRLREIDLFFKGHGVTGVEITEGMFELWASLREGESEENRRRRAHKLIDFAKYLKSRGHQNVYAGELPCRPSRRKPSPHIFTKPEIARVFAAARAMAAANPQSRDYVSFVTMLALYYCCGCRKTEVQNLKMRDIDLDTGCIRIMDSKNHVSRMVVASKSLLELLVEHNNARCTGLGDGDFVFRSGRSAQFSNHKLYSIYHEVLDSANIQPRENGRRPRLHDLRHTFCVHTLEEMSKKGFDLYVALPLLVRYLGHKCISETEYYLRLVEENFTQVIDKSRLYAPALFPKVGDPDGSE